MKTIELQIECPSCNGTGVYVGVAERNGASVICTKCNGAGAYQFKYTYNDFTGLKKRDDVTRVYKSGYGYFIAPGQIKFGENLIDMDQEGISYSEFLDGKFPDHITSLACPMLADQGACHDIKGFVDKCNELNGGWINRIADCKNQPNKTDCWTRFKRG